MQLLDRYLYAVGNHLPPTKRDDILRELRANILDSVEAREAELGRPLTLDEEEVLLKNYGHPTLVGTRYWPKQYLIGPTVFPYYIFALKTVLPIALLVYVVVNAVGLATQQFTFHHLADVFFGVQGLLLITAAWITLGFVVLEYAQPHIREKVRFLDDWRPRDLPQPEMPSVYNTWHAVAEVIVSGTALVWFLLIPQYPFLMFGPGADYLRFVAPVPEWVTFYWIFLLLLFIQWLMEVGTIFVPRFRRVRPVLGMIARAAIAVLFAFAVRLPAFVMLTDAAHAPHDAHSIVDALNMALHLGLKAVIAVIAIKLVVDIFRRVRAPHAIGYTTNRAALL